MDTIGKTALALASAAVLSGCAGDVEPTGTTAEPTAKSAATVQEKKYRFESVKADCMKQKGFKYIAYVVPEDPDTADERKRAVGDYEALKGQRTKYGFGVFSVYIHPKSPDSPDHMPDFVRPDPNDEILSKLSPAQHRSYWKAVNTCIVAAAKQVLGKKVASSRNLLEQASAASDRASKRELDGDPELVRLASDMVTCLTGKGYKVSGTRPSQLPARGYWAFRDQEDEIGRKQREGVPGVPPPRKSEGARIFGATLTPAQAEPYLAKEVRAALDDLECGKDFYPAFTPRSQVIQQKVDEEFAF
jgi:hypothetical protein